MKENKIKNKEQEEIKKFDFVFIGGGPSTLSFLCYIYQHNLNDKIFNSSNLLIIESNENFGSGCLGNYGINSNTSGEGFPRLICQAEKKEKYIKEGLSPTKKKIMPSENYNEKDYIKNLKKKSVKDVNHHYNHVSLYI